MRPDPRSPGRALHCPPPWGETQHGEGRVSVWRSWETMGSVRAKQLSANLKTQPIKSVLLLQLQIANLVGFFS